MKADIFSQPPALYGHPATDPRQQGTQDPGLEPTRAPLVAKCDTVGELPFEDTTAGFN